MANLFTRRLVLNAEREQHEDLCMCSTCLPGTIKSLVAAEIERVFSKARSVDNDDDAGASARRRPATHSRTAPLLAFGAPATRREGDDQDDASALGKPLLPTAFLTRKAS